jgi:hypothetical protein
MSRAVSDWEDAAADAYSCLNERPREYSKQAMWSLLDELAMRESATQEQMMEKHKNADFIATTLGHVTTAVHGPGSVPKEGGWYRVTSDPHTYHIHAKFATAWRAKRRLSRSESTEGNAMRAFVFTSGSLQAVSTDQAGSNLPNPPSGKWERTRQMDDVAKELSAQEVNTLQSEGFFIRKK